MNTLGPVSGRVAAIYRKFYEEREAQRALNLYQIFDELAASVEAASDNVTLHLDYVRLGELVRSYFLDAIRYKEYHFDPDPADSEFSALLEQFGYGSIDEVDPLTEHWTTLVHSTANINNSKVASYTVKWILACKPISVVNKNTVLPRSPGHVITSAFLSNINEYYALACALFTLEIDAADIAPKKLDELIYALRFRKYDESAFFMIFTKDYLLNGLGDG